MCIVVDSQPDYTQLHFIDDADAAEQKYQEIKDAAYDDSNNAHLFNMKIANGASIYLGDDVDVGSGEVVKSTFYESNKSSISKTKLREIIRSEIKKLMK